MYYLVIAVIVVIDQFAKHLVSVSLAPANSSAGGNIPVIPRFFEISYVRNTGAAFSLLQGQQMFLSVFVIIIVSLMLIYIFTQRKKAGTMLLAGVSLVAAGGLGNLIDRLRLGYVVDFFDFQVFPVFNIADISVCAGCGLALLYFALSEYRQGRGRKKEGA